jgi:hypothetical protein
VGGDDGPLPGFTGHPKPNVADNLPTMYRLLRLVLAVASMTALGGCASFNDSPERPLPVDAVQIRIYTEGGAGGNGMPETIRWTVQSVGAMDEWGVVSHGPEATCIVVGSQWTLSIDDSGLAVPVNPSRHVQFSGSSPLDLLIARADAGRLTVSEGLPEWMNGKPIGCAALHS